MCITVSQAKTNASANILFIFSILEEIKLKTFHNQQSAIVVKPAVCYCC